MIGFYLHLLTETPAIFGFLFFPSSTLAQPQPHASPVIRQYGVLLAVTSLILVSVMIDLEHRVQVAPGELHAEILRQRISGALAAYHVAPILRSIGRLTGWVGVKNHSKENDGRDVEKGLLKAVFSSPLVHLMLHGVCCALLIDMAFEGN